MNEINLKNSSPCPHCNYVIEFHDAVFILYFNSMDIKCPKCNNVLNLWNIFMDALDQSIFGMHYRLLGCEGKIDNITIKPYESILLDLNKVIGEGDLIHILFTVVGDKPTFPMHNVTFPYQFLFKYKNIILEGMPLNEDSTDTNINYFYWFAPEEVKKDLANMLLLDAFKFFQEENYRYMIISAHSAAEILQYKFFEKVLTENGVGKEKTEKFLTHAATYSYRLKTLMPFVCETMGFPKLNNQIYEGLENLRKDRNDLIHDGKTDLSDKSKLKRELISTFFAFKYFKIIHGL